MAVAVIMPRQGNTVESCVISKWHKQVGDTVAVGDVLVTYETDKATFDLESETEGVLLAILRPEGDDVPCLENICVIGAAGEDISAFSGAPEASAPAAAAEPVVETKTAPVAAPAAAAAPIATAPSGELKISPRARNLAERTGVDYRNAAGTGPEGRIIERDIIALREAGVLVSGAARGEGTAAAGTGLGGRVVVDDLGKAAAPATPAAAAPVSAPAAEYEDVRLSNIRKLIAKGMQASLNNTAQLTLNSSFDATAIMAYRKAVKASSEKLGLSNITLNDIILYAVSRVLGNHKDLNAHLVDDTMRYFKSVNLGFAVDTERGLMVPTIFNADKLSLNEISAQARDLANQCQKGTINPDLIKGATFTISNLGTLGIESFTPVINPPQTGILGVNTIVNKVKDENGSIKLYPSMGLSLTFDHRALDGAPAARFLQDLSAALENFSALLAK